MYSEKQETPPLPPTPPCPPWMQPPFQCLYSEAALQSCQAQAPAHTGTVSPLSAS